MARNSIPRRSPRSSLLRLPLLVFIAATTICPALPAGDDQVITQIYDVRDILHPRPDFPAPRLGLGGIGGAGIAEPFGGDQDEDNGDGWTMEELVDLIRQVIGKELEIAGAKVGALGSNLVISLPARSQERVSTILGGLRDDGRAVFTIDARWVELSDEALAELGFPPQRIPRAKRLSAEEGTRLLVAFAARNDLQLLSAPRMTIYANQRSHWLVVDQEAYVDRLDEGADGVLDPVIKVMNTGLTMEAIVRPRRGREGVILNWELQVARKVGPGVAGAGDEAEDFAAEPELGVPEVVTTVREGRTALRPGQFVAVLGLPSLESELPTLLLLSCTRSLLGEEKQADD